VPKVASNYWTVISTLQNIADNNEYKDLGQLEDYMLTICNKDYGFSDKQKKALERIRISILRRSNGQNS
jgi:prenyltransferase beta subunit